MINLEERASFERFAFDFKDALPGSYAAHLKGCKCPRIDNHHGHGYGGNGLKYGWVISGDCELHVAKPEGPA